MKTLRLWMLVLLAALLPLRGAMAAAMPCSMMAPASAGAAGAGEAMIHQVAPIDHAAMGHAMPDTAEPVPTQQPSAAPGSCVLCCDFCSVTPLAASLPTLPAAPEHSTLAFPDLCAPAPSFVSDGPERPPRST